MTGFFFVSIEQKKSSGEKKNIFCFAFESFKNERLGSGPVVRSVMTREIDFFDKSRSGIDQNRSRLEKLTTVEDRATRFLRDIDKNEPRRTLSWRTEISKNLTHECTAILARVRELKIVSVSLGGCVVY